MCTHVCMHAHVCVYVCACALTSIHNTGLFIVCHAIAQVAFDDLVEKHKL